MGLINIGEFYYMNTTTLQILFYCKIFGKSCFKYKNPFEKIKQIVLLKRGNYNKNKEEMNINILFNRILSIIFYCIH